MNICCFCLKNIETEVRIRCKVNISLTTLSRMGNRMLAQARLLVNSVKIALIVMTTKIIAV